MYEDLSSTLNLRTYLAGSKALQFTTLICRIIYLEPHVRIDRNRLCETVLTIATLFVCVAKLLNKKNQSTCKRLKKIQFDSEVNMS